MKPTEKSSSINNFLNMLSGGNREECIRNNVCIPGPIGCGGNVNPEDMSEMEIREYQISGMCRNCQNEVFETTEEEEVN